MGEGGSVQEQSGAEKALKAHLTWGKAGCALRKARRRQGNEAPQAGAAGVAALTTAGAPL
jgi:hypothetical protein